MKFVKYKDSFIKLKKMYAQIKSTIIKIKIKINWIIDTKSK